MRDAILYRLKVTALLFLFFVPIAVGQWSRQLQSQLDDLPKSSPPSPEFVELRITTDAAD